MPKWLKKAGIKIVALSPDLNYAAAVHADTWIPLKPNTDAALYLALAHTWIVEGRYDKDYVATHTIGFDEFKTARHGRGRRHREDAGLGRRRTPAFPPPPSGAGARVGREENHRSRSISAAQRCAERSSHLATRMEAYILCHAGHRQAGTAVPAHRRAVVLQEGMAQVPRYPEVDLQGPRAQPDDRIRDRQGTEVAGVRSAHAGRPRRSEQVDRVDAARPPHSPRPRISSPATVIRRAPTIPASAWCGTRTAASREAGATAGSGWRRCATRGIDFVVGIHPWLENDMPFSDLILPAQTSYEHDDLITSSAATSSACSIRIRRSSRSATR